MVIVLVGVVVVAGNRMMNLFLIRPGANAKNRFLRLLDIDLSQLRMQVPQSFDHGRVEGMISAAELANLITAREASLLRGRVVSALVGNLSKAAIAK